MGVIEGEPNAFLSLIFDVLEKLGIIPPSPKLNEEEQKAFIEMMKAKGFHFIERQEAVSEVSPKSCPICDHPGLQYMGNSVTPIETNQGKFNVIYLRCSTCEHIDMELIDHE
jgi:hypothetical protein